MHLELISTLIEIAKQSNMRKRYACIVVYQNKIISSGYNIRTTCQNRVPDDERKSYHAERNALINVKDKRILKRCRIYILRIDRYGNPYKGIPCDACYKFLLRKGITSDRIFVFS